MREVGPIVLYASIVANTQLTHVARQKYVHMLFARNSAIRNACSAARGLKETPCTTAPAMHKRGKPSEVGSKMGPASLTPSTRFEGEAD